MKGMTIKEASIELGVGVTTVQRLVKEGRLTVMPKHPLLKNHNAGMIAPESVAALKKEIA